jgi:hypothetical protein
MKKNLLLFFATILSYGAANASHLMGGQVTCEQISGLTYEIKATIYRDTLGIPIDLTGQIYIFETATGWNSVTSVNVGPANYIGNGVEEYEYTFTTSFPNNGDFVVAYYNCCRNGAIINIPNASTFGMYLNCNLHIDTNNNNSSPVFLNPPIPVAQVNMPYIHNPLPYDVDGDSLVWSIDVPQENNLPQNPNAAADIPGYTAIPTSAAMPLTMNALTGEISFEPTTLGNFVLSVICEEYRNGIYLGKIRRDVQIIVIPSNNIPPANMPACNHSPIFPGMYAVNVGNNFTYTITSSDADNQALDIISNGEPLFLSNNPALFTHTAGIGSANASFSWIPDASQMRSEPYLVTFSVQDQFGQFTFSNDYTIGIYVQPMATSMNEIEANSEVSLYPNPTADAATLTLQATETQIITIAVYNMLGAQLGAFRKVQVNAGNNLIQLNDLDLAAGNYVLQISGNQMQKTLPLHIIK